MNRRRSEVDGYECVHCKTMHAWFSKRDNSEERAAYLTASFRLNRGRQLSGAPKCGAGQACECASERARA